MGTGIVSIGLYLDRREELSRALLAVDVLLWLGLCAVFVRRVLLQRERWRAEAATPASLTAVAGTAVLGARFAFLGADGLAAALLVLALALWLVLARPVLAGWRTPTVGVSFVLVVSLESLAVLAALLGYERRTAWLAVVALAPFVLGLVAYAFVLARFDLRQLRAGQGDHWVAGGALAIATLASARIAEAAGVTSVPNGLRRGAADAALVLWFAAVAWVPALIAAEVVAPRLAYDTRRWSTVFPVGMVAVCSLATGHVTGVRELTDFGRAWIWVAFAFWAVVFAAMLRRGVAVAAPPVSPAARSGRRGARS